MRNLLNLAGTAAMSFSIAVGATALVPEKAEARFGGFNAGVADISRNVRRQVRHALRPRLVVDPKEKKAISDFVVSPDGRYVSALVPGEVLLWDARMGSLILRRDMPLASREKLAFTSSNDAIAHADTQGRLQVTDLVEGTSRTLDAIGEVSSVAFHPDADAWMAIGSDGTLLTVPRLDGEPRQTTLAAGGGCCVRALPGGNLALAASGTTLNLVSLGPDGIDTRRSWDLGGRVTDIHVSPAEKLVGVTTEERYYVVDPDKDGIVWSQTRSGASQPMGIHADHWYAVVDGNKIRRFDPYSGESSDFELEDFETRPIGSASLGHKTMALTTEDGLGYLVDLEARKVVIRWIVTNEGWTVVDEKGRFDGFASGVKAVAWEAGSNKVQLAGFAQPYYEPGLLGKTLGLQKGATFLSDARSPVPDGVFLPPKAELELGRFSDEGNRVSMVITATVETSEDGEQLEGTALFHNGKALPPGQLVSSDSSNGGKTRSWTYDIELVPGENLFFADLVAANGIRSRSDLVSLDYDTQHIAPGTQHVHSVGINRYASPELVLDYSVPDALAMAEKFTKEVANEGNVGSEVIKVDNKASGNSIRATLASLRELKPNDTVVLYLSGHGVVVDGEWYFMPQEGQSLSDADHIKRVGISGAELSEALIEAPVQRIFLAIDACQSGAIVDSFDVYKQRKVLQQLSDTSGVHILTATRADQLAPEFSQLGHGLFTYVMLQGMTKEDGYYRADRSPRDGHLSVEELKEYVIEQSPIVTIRLLQALLGKSKTSRGIEDLNIVVSPAQLSTGANFLFN